MSENMSSDFPVPQMVHEGAEQATNATVQIVELKE